MKRLYVSIERCSGCRACEMACSVAHEGKFGTSLSRIRVAKLETSGIDAPVVCRQCSNAPCAKVCPVGAISVSQNTGAKTVDPVLCIGCGACVEACPFGAMSLHPEDGRAIVCDLCDGNPRCVERCPLDALRYEDALSRAANKGAATARAMSGPVLKKWGIGGEGR
ncbi:MAG: 4Fe-4S dicluster domain-containing protein [Ignavibacteriales bacterium]